MVEVLKIWETAMYANRPVCHFRIWGPVPQKSFEFQEIRGLIFLVFSGPALAFLRP